MGSSLIFALVCTLKSSNEPEAFIGNLFPGKVVWTNELFQHSKARKFQSLEVKAAENNRSTKPNKQGTKLNSIKCSLNITGKKNILLAQSNCWHQYMSSGSIFKGKCFGKSSPCSILYMLMLKMECNT
ncbi:hypothetical protein UlMin_037698 [Ulmus minor]